MVRETSTLDEKRPPILEEKRRIERELGLPVEPPRVVPRGNNPRSGQPSAWQRLAAWVRGAPPPAR
ncbi:MAG TPA: hypothetical protein VGB42_06745 [Candidatus Thermoplasmatota archaeon]